MLNPATSHLSDLARMREIVTILAKYGLGEFMVRLKLSVRPRAKQQHQDSATQRYLSTPQRVRMAFEELGPTFIKLGQVLSTRVDVFGSEWTEEFAKLQSNVRPIPGNDIFGLIETQLGQPLAQVFQHISLTRLAAPLLPRCIKQSLLPEKPWP